MAQITYKLGFKMDKEALRDMEQGFRQLTSVIDDEVQSVTNNLHTGLVKAKTEGIRQAGLLKRALTDAATDGGISFQKMNASLKQSGTSAAQMVQSLTGADMKVSLNLFLSTFASANRNFVVLNEKAREFQRILKQSVQYAAAMNIQRFIIGQIQGAITWVQQLNAEIVKIGNFAEMSGAQMERTFEHVIKRARELNVTALDYAQAAFIFYQQGLPQEEVDRRADTVIRAARASLQDITETGKQMTAIWNTYRMSGDEIERAASVAAALSSTTAAQFADIAQGMQIAASGASMLGVAYDSLAAIMSTVVSVTQQSASVVGNAYKTIFARLANLRAGGVDEEGVELGRITQQLDELGINVLDATGNLRDLDDVIMNVGLTWDTYTQKQQIAIAQVVGGIRQYQHFLALMQNFDMYLDNLATANAEVFDGALTRQYLISLQSIDHAKRMKTEAWREAFSNLFPVEAQRQFYSLMTNIARIVGDTLEGFGGLQGMLVIGAALLANKIVPLGLKIKDTFMDMWNNRDLGAQTENMQAHFDKMQLAMSNAHLAAQEDIQVRMTAGEISDGAGEAEIRELQLQHQYQEGKLKLTREHAIAQLELNDIIANGTADQKARAQIMKDQHAQQHRNQLALMDQVEEQDRSNRKLQESLELKAKINKIVDTRETASAEEIDNAKEELAARKAIEKQNNAALESARQRLEQHKDYLESLQKEVEIKTLSRQEQNVEAAGTIQEAKDEIEQLKNAQKQADLEIAEHRTKLNYSPEAKAAAEAAIKAREEEKLAIQAKIDAQQKIITTQEKIRKGNQGIIDSYKEMVAAQQAKVNGAARQVAMAETNARLSREHTQAASRGLADLRAQGEQNNLLLQTAANLMGVLNSKTGDVSGSTKELSEEVQGVKEQLEAAISQIENAEDLVLGEDLQEQKATIAGFRDVIEDITQNTEDADVAMGQLAALMQKMGEATGTTISELDDFVERTIDTTDVTNKLAAAIQNRKHLEEQGHQITKDSTFQLQHLAQASMKVAGGFLMLQSGINSLNKAWREGNLTLGQFLSSMLRIIPGTIMMATELKKLNAVKAISTKMQMLLTLSRDADLAAQIRQIKGSEVLTIAQKKEKIATLLAAKGWVAKGLAMKFALWPIGAIKVAIIILIAKIALLVAAFVALVAVIALVARRNREAREAAIANAEAHAKLAQEATKAKISLQGMANTLRDLRRDMEAGTATADDYASVIADLQRQANELNEANPTLMLQLDASRGIQGMQDQITEAAERMGQQAATSLDEATAAVNRLHVAWRETGEVIAAGHDGSVVHEWEMIAGAVNSLGENKNQDVSGINTVLTQLGFLEDGIYNLVGIAENIDIVYALLSYEDAHLLNELLSAKDGFDSLLDASSAANQAEAMRLARQKEGILEANQQLTLMNGEMGDLADWIIEINNHQSDFNDQYRETRELTQELIALQAELDDAGKNDDTAELEQQIRDTQAALNDVSASIDENSAAAQQNISIMEALRNSNHLSAEEAQRMSTAYIMLTSNLRNFYRLDSSEQAAHLRHASQLIADGRGHLIGFIDDGTFELRQQQAVLRELTDLYNNWGSNETVAEQAAAIADMNQRIREFNENLAEGQEHRAIEELGNDFLLLASSAQEAILAQRANASAAEDFANAQLLNTQVQADAQAALQRGAGEALQAWDNLIERGSIGRDDEDEIRDWAQGYADAINRIVREGGDFGEWLERQAERGISEASLEAFRLYYNELNQIQDRARRSEEEAGIAIYAERRRQIEVLEETQEVLNSLNADSFNGSLREQEAALIAANTVIQEYNDHLRLLHGENAPQIAALPPYFLALNDAQQNLILSSRQLTMAQAELTVALETYGAGSIQAAIATENLGRRLAQNANLDHAQMERYATHLQRMSRNSDILSDSLNTNRRAALELATGVMRMNRGIESAATNFESWSNVMRGTGDALRAASHYSQEFVETLFEMDEAISDMLNIDPGTLTSDFLMMAEVLDLVGIMATGSGEAVDNAFYAIQDLAIEDIFKNMSFYAGEAEVAISRLPIILNDFESHADALREKYGEAWTTIALGADDLAGRFEYLQKAMEGIRETPIGEELSDDVMGFVNAAVDGLTMTAEEFRNLQNAMGITLDYNTHYEPMEMSVPSYTTHTVEAPGQTITMRDPDGPGMHEVYVPGMRTFTVPGPPKEVTGYKAMVTVGVNEKAPRPTGTSGTPPSNTIAGGGNPGGAGGGTRTGGRPALRNRTPLERGEGGGGGSGPDLPSLDNMSRAEIRESDPLEARFHGINRELERANREMSRLMDSMANLHGPARIAAMERYQQLLQRESALKAELIQQASAYIEVDQQRMRDAISDFNDGTMMEEFNRMLYEVYGEVINAFDGMQLNIELDFDADLGDLRNYQAVLTQFNRFRDAANGAYNDLVRYNQEVYASVNRLRQELEQMEGETDEAHAKRVESNRDTIESYNQRYEANAQLRRAYGEELENLDAVISRVRDLNSNLNTLGNQREDAYDAVLNNVRRILQSEIERIQYQVDIKLRVDQREIERLQWMIGRIGTSGARTAANMVNEAMQANTRMIQTVGSGAIQLATLLERAGEEGMAALGPQFADALGITNDAFEELLRNGEAYSMITAAIQDKKDDMERMFRDSVAMVDQTVQIYMSALQSYLQQMDQVLGIFGATMSAAQAVFSIWEAAGGHYRDASKSIRILGMQYQTLVSQANAAASAQAMWSNMIAHNHSVINDLRRAEAETGVPMGAQIDQLNASITDLQTRIINSQLEQANNFAQRVNVLIQQMGIEADRIIRDMASSLNGFFSSMEQAMQQFNQHVDIDTFFLSPRTMEFEMRQMMRRIENEMEGWDLGDNPELQARHEAWVRRINRYKEEGVQLTQAQLDILKAEFDLEIAKAAFEEEQYNRQKTTMRLARDASGNWSYVFSDDQDDSHLDDMEARIDELQHNIYQMHRDAALSHERMWMQVQVDMNNFIQNINRDLYNSNTEAGEAYRRHVARTLENFRTMGYKHATQIQYHNGQINRSFETTSLGYVTGTQCIMEANEKWMANQEATKVALDNNWQNYMNQINKYVGKIEMLMAMIAEANAHAEAAAQQLADEGSNAMADLAAAVNAAVNEMIRAFEELAAILREIIDLMNEVNGGGGGGPRPSGSGFGRGAQQNNQDWDLSGQGRGEAGVPWGAGGGGYDINAATERHLQTEEGQEQARRGAEAWSQYLNRTITPDQYAGFFQSRNGWRIGNHGMPEQWIEGQGLVSRSWDDFNGAMQQHLSQFARGGLANFTGPAWLDGTPSRPELVLNPEDTRNLLSTVETMRDNMRQYTRMQTSSRINQDHSNVNRQMKAATQAIQERMHHQDRQMQQHASINSNHIKNTQQSMRMMQEQMTRQIQALGHDRSSTVRNLNHDTRSQILEQRVQIDATFPNVTDSNEISDALNGLINQAAQYRVRPRF